MRVSPAVSGVVPVSPPLRCAGCAIRSNSSPPRSERSSPRTSPTSTGPCSRWSTCRRPSRGRFLPAIRAIPGPCGGSTSRSSPPTRRPAAGPSTTRRASARRSCTSGSSSATATTRSPRSAAPTSPASGSPTSSPRCCSAAASPPTSSSRPATSPTTSRCPDGGYRFYRDEELGPEFGAAMDELFAIYSRSLTAVEAWAAERWPRGDGEPEGAWQRSIRAKALDLLRGLLPAATLSHVGIYASGQAYEQLILRLMASPLPEAREYGGMILAELQQVMPSFVSRVERPDRGGEWISYLERRREQTESWVARLGLDRRGERRRRPLGRADPRRRQRRGPARRLPVRGRRARPRPRSSPASTSSTATSGPSCWRRWSASAPTAATAPAAASRRCATASRSSPTTAPSATCSATGC